MNVLAWPSLTHESLGINVDSIRYVCLRNANAFPSGRAVGGSDRDVLLVAGVEAGALEWRCVGKCIGGVDFTFAAGAAHTSKCFTNLLIFFCRHLNFNAAYVLLKVLDSLDSRDGEDVGLLSANPGENNLGRGRTLASRELFEVFDKSEILSKVLWAEAWQLAATIANGKVIERLETSRQEPAAKGRVGDQGNSQLTAGR